MDNHYKSSEDEICAKMVPKLLKEEQKEWRVQMCHYILEQLKTEPNLLEKVITGDKSWIFEDNPENKQQSFQWKSSTSQTTKKARMAKSKIKVVLIAFLDMRSIAHAKFLPQGQTINQHIYIHVL